MTPVENDRPLRLIALDVDDLAVLSANLQDALIPVTEMTYRPAARQFALAGRRFNWLKATAGQCERCASGLHFDCVRGVERTGFSQTDGDRVLNLLAINFEATDVPSGIIVLTFTDGAAIRLQVECIEAQMHDLGPCWTCDKPPSHALETS